ncbi:MAG TPA: DEAD/DEAH box helicase, partial [Candidatus Aminicenantes bacterium]|nr:DEAD/DEAH box helicase [Candidatus Aminicenantes bacterium]
MENAFQTLGLKDSLVQGVRELGFTDPTPIQLQVIPKLLHSPRDIIALAPTGTGKTAAFGLPILQRLDPELRHVQALVLSPTRELCVQIGKDLQDLGSQLPFLRVVPLYGGAGIGGQIGKLEKHPQVAVATPGRLLDLLRRKKIDLSKIGTLVLDEADEMLKMGFAEDLAAIAAFTPEGRQTLLFSATLPKEVEVLSGQYLKNPEVITLGRRNAGVETVEHHFCVLEEKNRYEGLRRILDLQPEMYAIIFCRTRL